MLIQVTEGQLAVRELNAIDVFTFAVAIIQ